MSLFSHRLKSKEEISNDNFNKKIVKYGRLLLDENVRLNLVPINIYREYHENPNNSQHLPFYKDEIFKHVYYKDTNEFTSMPGIFIKDFKDGYRYFYFKEFTQSKKKLQNFIENLYDKGFNFIKKSLHSSKFLGYYYPNQRTFIYENVCKLRRVNKFNHETKNVLINNTYIFNDISPNKLGFLIPFDESIEHHLNNSKIKFSHVLDGLDVFKIRNFNVYKNLSNTGFVIKSNKQNNFYLELDKRKQKRIGNYIAGKKTKRIFKNVEKSVYNISHYSLNNSIKNSSSKNSHSQIPNSPLSIAPKPINNAIPESPLINAPSLPVNSTILNITTPNSRISKKTPTAPSRKRENSLSKSNNLRSNNLRSNKAHSLVYSNSSLDSDYTTNSEYKSNKSRKSK